MFMCKIFSVIFALTWTINAVVAEERSNIIEISKEQIKSIGDEVEFSCTVKNSANYSVLWIKLNKDRSDGVPLSSNSALIIYDKRYSVTVNPETSTFTLKIQDLQEVDKGFYQCQILITVTDKISREVELQIKRAPSILVSKMDVKKTEKENGTLELNCTADGFPIPRISWKREHDALLPDGGVIFRNDTLRIRNVTREDRGIYTCIAENGVGSPAQANISVKIEFPPLALSVKPRVGQALGYDVNLECLVESYPSAEITWWRNDNHLQSNTDLNKDDKKDEILSVLSIYDFNSNDVGEYKCKATNKYGSSETKIELFETSIPVCADSCR